MKNIVSGIRRFQAGYFAENHDLFQELAEGQRPSTLFITCSDSRVLPNAITDTRPGELFMIRNAGNMMPNYAQASSHFSGEGATVQYAVEVLNVEHIVVCGHSDCGAVKALLQPPEKLLALDLVHRWVDQAAQLRHILQIRFGHLTGKDLQMAAIEQNVLIQLADLLTYPFVQERLRDGRLQVHGWVYHIISGAVTAYDRQRDGFTNIFDLYDEADVAAIAEGGVLSSLGGR
jgi:carbonic anhydrase